MRHKRVISQVGRSPEATNPSRHIVVPLRNTIETTIEDEEGQNVRSLELCQDEQDALLLSQVDFEKEIKIDFINGVDLRIMCRFLGVFSVGDLKEYECKDLPIFVLLIMQNIEDFMKEEGYVFCGELNFDNRGNAIPTKKEVWIIKEKEIGFTTTGYLYFEKIEGKNRRDNIVLFTTFDRQHQFAQISSFTDNEKKSERIMLKLIEFSKLNNCLRGAKIKEINVGEATFKEVGIDKIYTWDNYYFTNEVKDLFDLEVFGFLNDIQKYNKLGIKKRGIILHGSPGSGKTTLGFLICNNLPNHTVIWVTPEVFKEQMYNVISSPNVMYKFAEFVTPCLILLEDLDLYANNRDASRDNFSLGALMNILDGVNSVKNAITVGTTNRLETIESAIQNRPGRFDRVIEVKMNTPLREIMLKERLKAWEVNKDVFDELVKETESWTGAQIQEFVNTLELEIIHDLKALRVLNKKLKNKVLKKMVNFGLNINGPLGFSKKKE